MIDTNTITDTSTPATSTSTPTPSVPKNSNTKAIENKVREIARAAAAGENALPALAETLIKAADAGYLTTEKVHDIGLKDSKGQVKKVDDAEKLYDIYVKEESKKTTEHTSGGKKANISKMRVIIEASMPNQKWNMVDVYTEGKAIRDTLKAEHAAANGNAPKVKGLYPFIIDVCRQQLKQDTPLNADELRQLAIRPEAPEKEVKDYVKQIMKKLENMIAGNGNAPKCTDQEIIDARDSLKSFVGAMERAEEEAELRKKVAALGFTLTVDTSND